MKMILRRNDNTSICCSPVRSQHNTVMVKTKFVELTIACVLIIVGLYLIVAAQ